MTSQFSLQQHQTPPETQQHGDPIQPAIPQEVLSENTLRGLLEAFPALPSVEEIERLIMQQIVLPRAGSSASQLKRLARALASLGARLRAQLVSWNPRKKERLNVEEVNEDLLLFELRGQDGHVWKLYESGAVRGFPDGILVINSAVLEMDLLRGRIKQLQAAGVAGQQS